MDWYNIVNWPKSRMWDKEDEYYYFPNSYEPLWFVLLWKMWWFILFWWVSTLRSICIGMMTLHWETFHHSWLNRTKDL